MGTTSINDIREVITNSLKATPNPFSIETMISYKLPIKVDKVTFSIFNISGVKVDEIFKKTYWSEKVNVYLQIEP